MKKLLLLLVTCCIIHSGSLWAADDFNVGDWYAKYLMHGTSSHEEPANDSSGKAWYEVGYDDSSWGTVRGPIGNTLEANSYYPEYAEYYLRRTIHVDNTGCYLLKVSSDDDATVYINGTLVCENPSSLGVWHKYEIPAGTLHEGENLIAVYVEDGGGGYAHVDFGLYWGIIQDGIEYESFRGGLKITRVSSSDVTIPEVLNVNGIAYPVVAIGADAFNKDVLGSSFEGSLPQTIQIIERNAFKGAKITSISLPYCEYIEENAFQNCVTLTSAILPTCKTIGDRSFYGCASLETLDIPVCASVGQEAFYNANLISVNAPNLTNIGTNAFGGITLGYGFLEDWEFRIIHYFSGTSTGYGAELLNYAGNEADIVIPEIVSYDGEDFPVIRLGNGLFAKDTNHERHREESRNELLKSVVLPPSLIEIGDDAFKACVKIKSVDIPDGVRSIGDYAFFDCESLLEFRISQNSKISYIGNSAFESCRNLKKFRIPDGLRILSPALLYDCGELDLIITENSQLEELCCQSLRGVSFEQPLNLPVTLKRLEDIVFCEGGTSIVHFDENCPITEIPDWLNAAKGVVRSINIPNNVKSLREGSYSIDNLSYLYVPSNVTRIDRNALEFGKQCSEVPFIVFGNDTDISAYSEDAFGSVAGRMKAKVPSSKLAEYKRLWPNIRFIEQDVETITLNAFELSLSVNSSYRLKASVTPRTALSEVIWSSSDETIVKVTSNGTVTGLKEGSATITATAADGSGVTATVEVSVTYKPLSGIYFPKSHYGMRVGDSYTMQIATAPADASDRSFSLVSSDPSVVSVQSDGTLTAKAIGSATITATSNDNPELTAVTTVDVKMFSPASWSIEEGEDGFVTFRNVATDYYLYASDNDWRLRLNPNGENTRALFQIHRMGDDAVVTEVEEDVDYYVTAKTSRTNLIMDYGFRYHTSDKCPVRFKKDADGYWYMGVSGHVMQQVYTTWDDINPFQQDNLEEEGRRFNVINSIYCPEQMGATVTGQSDVDYTLIIPEELSYQGEPVQVIAIVAHAFRDNANIVSLTLPATLRTIGECAFHNCRALSSVNIPDAITVIENEVFQECASLTSVSISENSQLQSIGRRAFGSCGMLTEIYLPETLVTIGDRAFEGTALKSVSIPASVEKIDDGAFRETPLEQVTFADGSNLGKINGWVFENCRELKNINLPTTITAIGDNAFNGTYNLEQIDIPAGVQTIGAYAFHNGPAVINIPATSELTKLGVYAFQDNARLYSLNIPAGVTALYAGVFENCTNLASVNIPSNSAIEMVGYNAFQNCSNLKMLVLPASVNQVAASAFNFGEKNTLLIFNTDDPSNFDDNALKNVGPNVMVKVPSASLQAYKEKYPEVHFIEAEASSIAISESSMEVSANNSYTLSATVAPADAIQEVEWISSDPTIATVDAKGNVEALAEGDVTITVKTVDGTNLSADCQLHVSYIPVEEIALAQSRFTLRKSNKCRLGIVTTPLNSSERDYTIVSSNENVVAVSKDGSIHAVGLGEAQVTITSTANAEKTATATIVVKDYQPARWRIAAGEEAGTVILQDVLTGGYLSKQDGWETTITNHLEGDRRVNLYISRRDDFEHPVTEVEEGVDYNISYRDNGYFAGLVSDVDRFYMRDWETSQPVNFVSAGDGTYYIGVNGYAIQQGSVADDCLVNYIDNEERTVGNWTMTVYSGIEDPAKLSAKLVSYNGATGDIFTIPSTIGGEYTATKLGADVLSGKSLISGVVIPASIREIEEGAFKGCSSLTDVTFEDGKNTLLIGHHGTGDDWHYFGAFHDAPLARLYLGRILRRLEGEAPFEGKTSLKSVEFGPYCSRLENSLFANCTSLATINGAENLREIGGAVFNMCNSLVNLTGFSHVTSIGYNAFYGCNSLESIDLNDVTDLSTQVFGQCHRLSSVGNLSKVKVIDTYCFENCENLSSIGTLNAATRIGDYAFGGCNSLETLALSENLTSIGNEAFRNAGLKSLTIPNSVTAIGTEVFSADDNRSNLESVTLGTGLTSLSRGMFRNCVKLTELNLPSNIVRLADEALYNCIGLTEMTVPATVTSLGENVFHGMHLVHFASETPATIGGAIFGSYDAAAVKASALADYRSAWSQLAKQIVAEGSYSRDVNVTASENASSLQAAIGTEELDYVINLKVSGSINSRDIFMLRNKMPLLQQLDLSDANIVACEFPYYDNYCTEKNILGPYAFAITSDAGPNALYSVKLPNSVKEIGYGAFNGCKNLQDVVLGTNTKVIRGWAFSCNWNESHLKHVTFNEGLETIEDGAFYHCYNIENLELPMGLKLIEHEAFAYNYGLRSVTYPASLEAIRDNAFRDCAQLQEVRFPTYLNWIGYEAFAGCRNLREARIPSMLEYVQARAFADCDNLQDVYTYTVEPISINQNTFSCFTTATLYIPKQSHDNYWYDTQWGQFREFDDFDEPYESFYVNGDYKLDESKPRLKGCPYGHFRHHSGFRVIGKNKQKMKDIHLKHNGKHGSSLIPEEDNIELEEGSRLYVDIDIEGERWYFFSFPFDIRISEISCKDGEEVSRNFVFRQYDGNVRAANGVGGWQELPAGDESLHAGHGYIFRCEASGTLVLPAVNPDFSGADATTALEEYASDNAEDASWNFVGTPYTSYYDLNNLDYDAPITVWNAEMNTYETVRPGDDNYEIIPFQGFFTQLNGNKNGGLGFKAENRETYNEQEKKPKKAPGPRRNAAGEILDRSIINIVLNHGEQSDRTRIVINEEQSLKYEADCDAAKFMSMEAVPQVYTLDSRKVKYSINERPAGNGIIPLGYCAYTAGTFTLEAVRMDTPVEIKDRLTGATFDLNDGGYQFETEAGTFNDRFQVILKAPTEISDILAKTGIAIEVKEGGISFVNVADKQISIYDLTGALLKNEICDGFVSMPSGIYLIRVEGLTTKVIVK